MQRSQQVHGLRFRTYLLFQERLFVTKPVRDKVTCDIRKPLSFLRRMASNTSLSARFGFSGLYPGFPAYQTSMFAR